MQLIKKVIFNSLCLALITSTFIISGCAHDELTKIVIKRDSNFNNDWRFINEDIQDAMLKDFDDSNWRTVDLPHDWSIEDFPQQDSLQLVVHVVKV